MRVGVAALVVVGASLVFAVRYLPAFTDPNFYAEDGTVFVAGILEKGPFYSPATPFNGYLVSGTYLLTQLAMGAHAVAGLPFAALPFVIALVSVLWLGLCASLPYLCFRTTLGEPLALAAVVLLTMVPLPEADFKIIGTVANTKFSFFFVALVLILLRWKLVETGRRTRYIPLIDFGLLVCALTLPTVIALLPLIIIHALRDSYTAMRTKSIRPLLSISTLSAAATGVLAAWYLALTVLDDSVTLEGYLDDPFIPETVIAVSYRVTTYQWLFPATPIMNDFVAVASIVALLAVWSILGYRFRRLRLVAVAVISISIATVGFFVARPGLSILFTEYRHASDEFFYPQSWIVAFLTCLLLSAWAGRGWRLKSFLGAVALFVIVSAPFGGSWGDHLSRYDQRHTIYQTVETACRGDGGGDDVTVELYPNEEWSLTVPRETVCN